jgi:hypothetical protein
MEQSIEAAILATHQLSSKLLHLREQCASKKTTSNLISLITDTKKIWKCVGFATLGLFLQIY